MKNRINPKMTQRQIDKLDASHYQDADRYIADDIDKHRHGNDKTDAKHRMYHAQALEQHTHPMYRGQY